MNAHSSKPQHVSPSHDWDQGPSKLGVAAMSSAIEAFCFTLFGFGMILDRDTNGFYMFLSNSP